MEIFFVLSGYLVGGILLRLANNGDFTYKKLRHFWVRRWFRTLPAYYLVLLLNTGFYYYLHKSFIFSDYYYLLYLVFSQNFFVPHPYFFIVAWSLSVEEWFYLLIPLTVYFSKKLFPGKRIVFLIISWILIITFLRIGIVYKYDPSWDFGVRMIVPLRLDSLMIGVLMAWLSMYYNSLWRKYARKCFYAGILIILISSCWLYIDVIRTGVQADFFSKTFLFNLFSLGFALCLPLVSLVRYLRNYYASRIIQHISLISYSLYLTHSMVSYVFIAVCNKLDILTWFAFRFTGTWIICIAVATFMYKLYEKPFTNLREKYSF